MLSYESLPLRIQAKIQMPGNRDECWLWTATVSSSGYGRIYWEGVVREAHRIVYMLLVEPLPGGVVLDHVCHDPAVCRARNRECLHRRCQNPGHMKPVTRGDNALRGYGPPAVNAEKDRCDNGHLYRPGSYSESEGHRRCLICRREQDKKRRPRGVPRKGSTRTGEFHPMPGFPEQRIQPAT